MEPLEALIGAALGFTVIFGFGFIVGNSISIATPPVKKVLSRVQQRADAAKIAAKNATTAAQDANRATLNQYDILREVDKRLDRIERKLEEGE